MILGGSNTNYTGPVELYNADTGQQCQLGNIPLGNLGPQAVNFAGTPFFCGGQNPSGLSTDCYMYFMKNDTWSKVIILISNQGNNCHIKLKSIIHQTLTRLS